MVHTIKITANKGVWKIQYSIFNERRKKISVFESSLNHIKKNRKLNNTGSVKSNMKKS